MKYIRDLRVDYTPKQNLNLGELPNDPIDLFKIWFEEANDKIKKDPNAMAISTIDSNGFPRTRFVLLKELTQRGFIFYTNYTSQKGKDIEGNDKVSLTFLWKELDRQVRIVGSANKIDRKISQEYFHSRPRESQIAAYISAQSSPLDKREDLEKAYDEAVKNFEGLEIPYPRFWGGFEVQPLEIEFWQGRESRLHDRVLYKMNFSSWDKCLLQP